MEVFIQSNTLFRVLKLRSSQLLAIAAALGLAYPSYSFSNSNPMNVRKMRSWHDLTPEEQANWNAQVEVNKKRKMESDKKMEAKRLRRCKQNTV